MIITRILSQSLFIQGNALQRITIAGSSNSSLFSLRFKSSNSNVTTRKEKKEEEEEGRRSTGAVQASASYWGITDSKPLKRDDGAEWKWKCFMPSDTYKRDLSVDLKKSHKPNTMMDKLALWAVKSLRIPTDIFFKKRYGCRAVMLETVAAVPGMVGGMLLHLRSLRRFEHSGGWIRVLMAEAENERMHLMTFMEVSQPQWYERLLVIVTQGIFFNLYFLGYLISPKFAHRVVGYLEEEAIYSYTSFLEEIESGRIENAAAPAIAIDYWKLPKDATLRDVVLVVRADEAHHRDVNHYASDIQCQGFQLMHWSAPMEHR